MLAVWSWADHFTQAWGTCKQISSVRSSERHLLELPVESDDQGTYGAHSQLMELLICPEIPEDSKMFRPEYLWRKFPVLHGLKHKVPTI